MAEIKTFESGDLTVRRIIGEVTAKELLSAIRQYYSGKITKHLVWDETEGSVLQWTHEDVRSIAEIGQKHAHARIGGKTAIVTKADVDFGMGKIFESVVALQKTSLEVRVFRSLAEAADWIGVDVLPGIGNVTKLPDKPNQP